VAATEIRIRVPHPSAPLLNNLLGALGLVAIVIAVGGLAGWLWGLLAGGIFAVALSVIGSTHYAPAEDAAVDVDDGADDGTPGERIGVLDAVATESA